MAKTLSEIKNQVLSGAKIIRLVINCSPKWSAFYFAATILNSITPSLSLYSGKLVFDTIVSAIATPNPQHYLAIFAVSLLALGTRALNSLFSSAANFGFDRLKDIFTPFVMQKVYHQAAILDVSYFDDPKFYDKIEKVQREVGYRPVNAMDQIVEMVSSFIGALSLAVVLFKLSVWAPFIIIIFSIPRLIFRLRYTYHTYSLTDSRSPYNRKIWQINYLLTDKDSAAEMKIFDLKDYFLGIFKQINSRFVQENKTLALRQNLYSFLLDLLGLSTLFGLGLYAASLTVLRLLTLGDLSMITGAIGQFQTTLQGIFAYMARFYENNLFLSHYFEFMALKPRISSPPNSLKITGNQPLTVEFRKVSFGYDPQKPVLKNLSFKIDAAKNFALVGENGAGKTTIVKLILRLYDVTNGQVLINGIDIKKYNLASLRQNMGVIFQDYGRYEVSARENIAFGDVSQIKNTAKIKQAASLSGADKLIEKLPNGYDTMLGKYFEKGEELSGGQWQKIALARAFFTRAKILIMDEPTSALDPKSEYEVFENLVSRTKNKSLILISHRFSTVRLANQILVLDGGEIIEQGSHEELMAKNGHYAHLYKLQARWYK